MRRIKLTIEFDGTDFCGWQIQSGVRTVQSVIEQALEQLIEAPVRIHSSGRTDSGVHARSMVAHFDTERDLPIKAYRDGLNQLLPQDVVILAADQVANDFHARYAATGKWYRYSIWTGQVRSPLQPRVWHLRGKLDLDSVRRAAELLVGRHDFAAFRASSCVAKTTVREIYSLDLTQDGELLHIDIRGSGFLQHMVRIITGTLIEVGKGKRNLESVSSLLANKNRDAAGITAPGPGLCLMEVYY